MNKSKGMKPEHLSVSVTGGNRFSEVLVCYDKKFKLAACDSKGTPDDIEVRVAAKR
jgi:ribonuclease I